MKSNYLKIGLCVFGLFAYSQTIAQQPPKKKNGAKETIEKLDLDKDGKVSMAEAQKAEKGKLKTHFKEIDKNADGFVDLEELKAFRQQEQQNKQKTKKEE